MPWDKNSKQMKTYMYLIDMCKLDHIDSVTIGDAVRKMEEIWESNEKEN